MAIEKNLTIGLSNNEVYMYKQKIYAGIVSFNPNLQRLKENIEKLLHQLIGL